MADINFTKWFDIKLSPRSIEYKLTIYVVDKHLFYLSKLKFNDRHL